MKLFDCFKSKQRLILEKEFLHKRICFYKNALNRANKCNIKYYIQSEGKAYTVLKQYNDVNTGYTVFEICIKKFPKGDDPAYACLCANELLSELQKDM